MCLSVLNFCISEVMKGQIFMFSDCMKCVLLTDRLVADFSPLPFRGLKFDLWPDIKTGLKRK